MPLQGPHYRKKDHWTPRHYGDELQEEGLDTRDGSVQLLEPALDTSSREECCHARVRCPNCGRRRPAAAVVDCRHIPDDLSDGTAWACDACWTTWIRPSGRVNRTRAADRTQRMSEAEWAALHGAPRQVVDRFRSLLERRRKRGWAVERRIGERIDLDEVSAEADDPRELPPLPDRPEGRPVRV